MFPISAACSCEWADRFGELGQAAGARNGLLWDFAAFALDKSDSSHLAEADVQRSPIRHFRT